MSKKEYYVVNKNYEKLLQGKPTNFLDPNIFKKVAAKLKKDCYNIYYPYKDSEKIILYINEPPKIKLIEIIAKEKLKHREIMGTLYNLSIEPEMFGDIIISDGRYYVFIISNIYNSLIKEISSISGKKVKLLNIPIEQAKEFSRKYEKIEIIVSSLRIDAVVSKIINKSRNVTKEKFNNNEIILNYEICTKQTHILKKGDIFSIRKYGKYTCETAIPKKNKNRYILTINKYID